MWRRVCAGALAAAVMVSVVVGFSSVAAADEVRDEQWYLDDLGITEAHELSQGAGVTIGLIDSGVDAEHPDLDGAVEAGTGLGSAQDDGLDDARNHGTGMASILAGRGNGDGGANGMLGVAPQATVVSVAVDGEERTDASIEDGIRWLADAGVDVISMSIGDASGSLNAVRYAIDKEVPIVASAGNVGSLDFGAGDLADTGWPASAPGVIPVTGTTQDGKFWDKSMDLGGRATLEPQLGLSAPATDIPAAEAGGGYATNSGTSGSAPIVAGTLALIKSAYPDLDYWDLMYRLQLTVDDKGDGGFDDEYGWGIVNPLEALTGDVELDDGSVSTEDDILPLDEQGRESGDEGDGGSGDGDSESGSDAGALTASSGSSWLPVAVVAGVVLLAVAIITPIVVSRSRKKKRAAATAAAGPPPVGGFPSGPPDAMPPLAQPVPPPPSAPGVPPPAAQGSADAAPTPPASDSPWAPPSSPSDSDRP